MNELSSISTPLEEFSLPAQGKRSRSPGNPGKDSSALPDTVAAAPLLPQESTKFFNLPGASPHDEISDDTAAGPTHGPFLDVNALMASVSSAQNMNEQAFFQYAETSPEQPPSAHTSMDMMRDLWDSDTLAQCVSLA